MNAKDAIRSSFNLSTMVLQAYIGDLDDADLMHRPREGCNHLAWQLGHLISSEIQLLEMIVPGQNVELPEGFSEAHSKEACNNDTAADYCNKATYVELFEKVRAASLATLDAFAEADLDNAAPEDLGGFCPTMGDMFVLIGTHPMMHAGQFVIVRRILEKPIVM